MGSADQIYIVLLGEGRHYFLTKGKTDSSVVLTPALNILIWVRPQEIAKKTSVWNISWSHDSLDLIKTGQLRGKSSMHTEDFFINDGCYGEAVETISESFPELDVVPSLALIIETIDSVNRSALVITSEQEEVLRVLNFIGEEQANSLQALLASVHIVS